MSRADAKIKGMKVGPGGDSLGEMIWRKVHEAPTDAEGMNAAAVAEGEGERKVEVAAVQMNLLQVRMKGVNERENTVNATTENLPDKGRLLIEMALIKLQFGNDQDFNVLNIWYNLRNKLFDYLHSLGFC